MGASLAVAGAIAGGAIALLLPTRYVSSAVLRVHHAGVTGLSNPSEQRRFTAVERNVLSRASLAGTIQRPSFHLYHRERTRLPLEDIIQTMRERDIRIEPLQPGHRFRISFEDPDRDVPPAVVRDLVTKFQENRAADGMIQAIEMPPGPWRSTGSGPAKIGIGLGAGTLLGALILLLRRRSWQWHLLVFGFAITGLAAGTVAFYGDFFYPDNVELGALGLCAGAAAGVFLLRRRARNMSKPELAIAATAANCGSAFLR